MLTQSNNSSSLGQQLDELRLLQALAEVLAHSMESPDGSYLEKEHSDLCRELVVRLKALEQSMSASLKDRYDVN